MNALFREIFAAFLLTTYATAKAATISASSGAAADVQTALNSAKAGDTIVIPAGSAKWTQGVTWNAPPNVTVKGAGKSATGGGDQTVIIDDYNSKQPLLLISGSGGLRITGITFQSGSAATYKDNGTITFYGANPLRIDHCHFIATNGINYKIVLIGGGVRGVLDHCILDLSGTNAIYFYNGKSGAGEGQGNYEWTQPTAFGSADYFFIEDNIINGDVGGGAYSTRIYDLFTASKVVARFNTLHQCCIGETHATGHARDDRGGRSQEAYGNMVTSSLARDPNFCLLDMENGTSLVWGNSCDQVYKNIYLFKVTRSSGATYAQAVTPTSWGYAGKNFNGVGSNWDGNTDVATGYPALDQPGRGPGDLLTGVFPSKVNSTTGTIAWPNQSLEPIYIWNNTGGIVAGWGGAVYSDQSGGRLAQNRDYYPQASGIQTSPTSPFDGSSGTGWGTLANRPITCTPGVAYFAIDEGSWNTSESNPYGVQQNGADGVLYKCTAPNTWTLYYTPYTYPHPLQKGGASNRPSPVTGVRIVPPKSP